MSLFVLALNSDVRDVFFLITAINHDKMRISFFFNRLDCLIVDGVDCLTFVGWVGGGLIG